MRLTTRTLLRYLQAVTIAVICLAINLTLSSAFIMAVKYLANDGDAVGGPCRVAPAICV